MFESLFAEIKILSEKIGTRVPADVSNTYIIIVSSDSSNNSSQSPVGPVSSKVISIETPAEAANDEMNLHPSVRDSVFYGIFHAYFLPA